MSVRHLLLENIFFSVKCSNTSMKISGKFNSSQWMHAYSASISKPAHIHSLMSGHMKQQCIRLEGHCDCDYSISFRVCSKPIPHSLIICFFKHGPCNSLTDHAVRWHFLRETHWLPWAGSLPFCFKGILIFLNAAKTLKSLANAVVQNNHFDIHFMNS